MFNFIIKELSGTHIAIPEGIGDLHGELIKIKVRKIPLKILKINSYRFMGAIDKKTQTIYLDPDEVH